MKIKSSLKENISTLKSTLKSQDIIYYEFENNNKKYCVAYVDSITDKAQIGELVVRPIFENNPENLTEVFYKLQIPHVKQITQLSEALKKLLSGHTLLLCDGDNFVISCDFLFYQSRAVAEPPTATVVRGPREGFTEDVKTNMSLVRKRLKTPNLQF